VASPDSVDVFNQKVIHASMGSFSRVKFFATELAVALAQASVPVLGCDLVGDDVHTLAPLRNAIVAIGSEGRGLSPEVRQYVCRYITIPRHGSAESLNAAVAAAIVCDNLRRVSGHNQAQD
jgi:TrmH family RNA methyltransferase